MVTPRRRDDVGVGIAAECAQHGREIDARAAYRPSATVVPLQVVVMLVGLSMALARSTMLRRHGSEEAGDGHVTALTEGRPVHTQLGGLGEVDIDDDGLHQHLRRGGCRACR